MKKALRIVLLVLAIIATVYCFIVFIVLAPQIHKHWEYVYDLEISGTFNQVEINEFKLDLYNLINYLATAIIGLFFALLYVVFTLKNGLAADIYNYSYFTIEEIRNIRDEKRKEDIKNTINTLNEELKTLENNTKSDE